MSQVEMKVICHNEEELGDIPDNFLKAFKDVGLKVKAITGSIEMYEHNLEVTLESGSIVTSTYKQKSPYGANDPITLSYNEKEVQLNWDNIESPETYTQEVIRGLKQLI